MFEVMSTMRAMRRLKPHPVPDQMLTRLVQAATWAPSAANIQGHSFVVVTA
jgi:nitroreductase